jgi:hypothetical protein
MSGASTDSADDHLLKPLRHTNPTLHEYWYDIFTCRVTVDGVWIGELIY